MVKADEKKLCWPERRMGLVGIVIILGYSVFGEMEKERGVPLLYNSPLLLWIVGIYVEMYVYIYFQVRWVEEIILVGD